MNTSEKSPSLKDDEKIIEKPKPLKWYIQKKGQKKKVKILIIIKSDWAMNSFVGLDMKLVMIPKTMMWRQSIIFNVSWLMGYNFFPFA